jgi:S-disulfanyl-L-cysteine oxidoreductase SoxD
MRCSPKLLLLPGVILLACIEGLAQGPVYHMGRPPKAEEMRALDVCIGPEGQGLPAGSGNATQGAPIYMQKCAICHGLNGEGGVGPKLVGGVGTLTDAQPVRTIGSFWPNAPSIWDFINRSMPQTQPGSLVPDEVYAVLAFLLTRNGIIKESDVLDATTLPKVKMPNHDGFVPAKPMYPEPAQYSGGCGSHACTKEGR